MRTLPRCLLLALIVASIANAAPIRGDDPQAREFVAAHNAVRASVRAPAGYEGPWVPLPPMEWSDDIAGVAQAWADHLHEDGKCRLQHSDARLGENLAIGKDLSIDQAVKMWAAEGERYRFNPVYEFEIPTGHYTQLVWRTSTRLGCGIAHCGRTTVMVCNYSPSGNYIGKPPY
jgi:pathogenesis-related protein 1